MRDFALILLAGLMVAGCRYADRDADEKKKEKKATAKAESPTARSEPAVDVPPGSERYSMPGFTVYEDDGRLWVFREDSDALEHFLEKGEPAKRVTMVGAGPDGRTVMGPDRETLEAYVTPFKYGREGFTVFADDGRLWVFRKNSEALVEFASKGEPAKRVTLVGAGPDGRTVMSADRETLDAYCAPYKYGREGFEVSMDDGRLWVFRKNSEAYHLFRTKGEPAKRVTLVGAGPDGLTVMGAGRDTLEDYLKHFVQQ